MQNDWKLTLGVDGQYSSKYSANTGRRPDFFQKAFAKVNANVTLEGPNKSWELAFIANNITNKFTTGNCTNLNYAGAQILPGIVSGGPTSGASGTDELICTYGQGREFWLRLTLRPLELLGRR
jgi:outer membrane receptor protein involved in Fe transport